MKKDKPVADQKTEPWRCPDCGRRFRHRTREHSCQVIPLATHLDGTSPGVKAAIKALIAALDKFGPYSMVPLKTMIVLRTKSNFGGVVVRKQSLDLGFFLTRHDASPRIRKVERISPKKLAHHIRVESASDIDSEVVGWLKESYAACAPRDT